MSRSPTISVVMPTVAVNVTFLMEAIASIVNQSYTDFELLVYFDGSSSEPLRLVRERFPDPRIRLLLSKKRRGLARSLNILVRMSRGRYIARMDDDDVSLPDRLQMQFSFMEESGSDVCGGYCFEFVSSSDPLEGKLIRTIKNVSDPNIFEFVFGKIFIHPTVMFRREWALRYKYNPAFRRGQDRELWLRAAPYSRYANLEYPILRYRRLTRVKKEQMVNVANTFLLLREFRSRVGWMYVPFCFFNAIRYVAYWIRVRLKGDDRRY